jgi:hypothetical protein
LETAALGRARIIDSSLRAALDFRLAGFRQLPGSGSVVVVSPDDPQHQRNQNERAGISSSAPIATSADEDREASPEGAGLKYREGRHQLEAAVSARCQASSPAR